MAGAWSKYNTGQFQGTIAFAYICFVMFQLFFWALVIFQSGVSEELGLREWHSGGRGWWWGGGGKGLRGDRVGDAEQEELGLRECAGAAGVGWGWGV